MTMEKNVVLVDHRELRQMLTELFETADMPRSDAAFHADCLVDTSLWGIDSHGVMRAPAYYARMRNGAIHVQPHMRFVRGNKALRVMDADAAAGFIAGRAAMEEAIKLARLHGVGAVGVVNSNHFSAGALYARMAAKEGMIGISMTNVLPPVIAQGASKPVVGNDPLAIAIPTYGPFPFCLDIAFSKVAGGKITLAIKKKEKIPMDWATDDQGRPTDDPEKAHLGFLQPMGDHKGLGLAQVVDILCGVITGGVFSHQMKSMYAYPQDPSLTGHFMMVLDLDEIMDRDELQKRMAEYYRRLKETPMWDPNRQIMMPGEIEYQRETQRRAAGVPVPIKTYEELMQLKREQGLRAPLTPLEQGEE